MRSTSVTGSASPARCNRPPSVLTSTKGDTRGEIPPSISLSAEASASRSSVRVSPPIIAASSSPSGFKRRLICASTPGRSLSQCIERSEITRSYCPGSPLTDSAAPSTLRASADPILPDASSRSRRATASGVSIRAACGNERVIVPSRAKSSSAARSSRNFSAPPRAARCCRSRRSSRSKMTWGAFKSGLPSFGGKVAPREIRR